MEPAETSSGCSDESQRLAPEGDHSLRTDEEDGEGDEEQEDMGNQVESVHEAAIVEYVARHAVANGTIFTAAERQSHAEQLHTHQQSNWKKEEDENTQISKHKHHRGRTLVNGAQTGITGASASESQSEISASSHTETETAVLEAILMWPLWINK